MAFIGALPTNSSGTQLALTNTYVPTGGNLVIVVGSIFEDGGSPAPFTLSDTRGNTIPTPAADITLVQMRQTVWVIPNCIGGSGNFAIIGASGVAADLNLDVYEFSGLSLTGALDGTPVTNSISSGTTLAFSGLVTSVAGSLLFSCCFDEHTADTSIGNSLAGGTQYILNRNTVGVEASDGYGVFGAAAGTYSNTKTLTTATNGAVGALLAIQAATGGGGAPIVSSLSSMNLGPG